MTSTFFIAGKLNREYILPPSGPALLDSPGGSLLYAAGGLAVWASGAGLQARVGEDFPRQWLHDLERRGFDVRAVKILPRSVDLRAFIAYTDSLERSQTNVVSHFARRQMTFPKSLLGYQAGPDADLDPRQVDPLSPSALDVPKEFRDVELVHLCPFDFTSQSQLVSLFKGGSTRTVSLDPAPSSMSPTFWRELRAAFQGVTVFQPSEEELRALFWGVTNDLWEMAREVASYGPQLIVIKRGAHGSMLFDAAANRRFEIPAYPARLADPTGAGDAFCGGFLAGWKKTGDALMAAIYGAVSASLKIEGSGPFYPLTVAPGLAEARVHSLQQLVRRV